MHKHARYVGKHALVGGVYNKRFPQNADPADSFTRYNQSPKHKGFCSLVCFCLEITKNYLCDKNI